MDFTSDNHYVPQWYQRRFMPAGHKEKKYCYLDLSPEKVLHPNGGYHFRDDFRRLGTLSCFVQEHLYTLFFGENASDEIEKRFFGKIDQVGSDTIELLANYNRYSIPHEAISDFIRFLDAQKLRTPKGLDYIKRIAGSQSHQDILFKMGELWQLHATIWSEGVWEILHCDDSETKFIVSDHPVTTYNRDLFPLARDCCYPLDAPIEYVGTHTIFPLSLTRCLVITNLGYVRNPKINPVKLRENPRYFAPTIFDIRTVQTGRQVTEKEARAINYILKSRAKRYIAATQKEWLYPEQFLTTTMWNKLGDQYFLMPDPRKVKFTSGIYFGNDNGSSWGLDEYGRRPREDDQRANALREEEWKTFQKAKQSWNSRFGPLTRDEMMRYF